jgi:hypothetical protein
VCVCASVCICVHIHTNIQEWTITARFHRFAFFFCIVSCLNFESLRLNGFISHKIPQHQRWNGDCHCESSTLIVQVTMDLLAISGESTDAAKTTDVHGSSSSQLGQWERWDDVDLKEWQFLWTRDAWRHPRMQHSKENIPNKQIEGFRIGCYEIYLCGGCCAEGQKISIWYVWSVGFPLDASRR